MYSSYWLWQRVQGGFTGFWVATHLRQAGGRGQVGVLHDGGQRRLRHRPHLQLRAAGRRGRRRRDARADSPRSRAGPPPGAGGPPCRLHARRMRIIDYQVVEILMFKCGARNTLVLFVSVCTSTSFAGAELARQVAWFVAHGALSRIHPSSALAPTEADTRAVHCSPGCMWRLPRRVPGRGAPAGPARCAGWCRPPPPAAGTAAASAAV